jgi:hypothetical protein
MRSVLVKDLRDDTCKPEWRELECMYEPCTIQDGVKTFDVLAPDPDVLPIAGDHFTAVLSLTTPYTVRWMQIVLPPGYSFAKHEDNEKACVITPLTFMLQTGQKCVVNAERNTADMNFEPNGLSGKTTHKIELRVVNPTCTSDMWLTYEVGEQAKCRRTNDETMWKITYAKFTGDEGAEWVTHHTIGYDIFESPVKLARKDLEKRMDFCSSTFACLNDADSCDLNVGTCVKDTRA